MCVGLRVIWRWMMIGWIDKWQLSTHDTRRLSQFVDHFHILRRERRCDLSNGWWGGHIVRFSVRISVVILMLLHLWWKLLIIASSIQHVLGRCRQYLRRIVILLLSLQQIIICLQILNTWNMWLKKHKIKAILHSKSERG